MYLRSISDLSCIRRRRIAFWRIHQVGVSLSLAFGGSAVFMVFSQLFELAVMQRAVPVTTLLTNISTRSRYYGN